MRAAIGKQGGRKRQLRVLLAILAVTDGGAPAGEDAWPHSCPVDQAGGTSERNEMLFALCGPSGVGKTTLLQAVIQRNARLTRLITSTTRASRPGEVEGVDYHFVSPQQFHAAVRARELVCPVCFRGAWYGTAQRDLRACVHMDRLAALTPDQIPCLAAYTPITGIFLTLTGRELPFSEADRLIIEHQHLCAYRVTNVYSKPEQAVEQLLSLIADQGRPQCNTYSSPVLTDSHQSMEASNSCGNCPMD